MHSALLRMIRRDIIIPYDDNARSIIKQIQQRISWELCAKFTGIYSKHLSRRVQGTGKNQCNFP